MDNEEKPTADSEHMEQLTIMRDALARYEGWQWDGDMADRDAEAEQHNRANARRAMLDAQTYALAVIAEAQTRQAMTWERIASLFERALPSMGNALAELAAAATDLDGQSAPALLAQIADTLRDNDDSPIGAGILSLLETIARNTGAIDDEATSPAA